MTLAATIPPAIWPMLIAMVFLTVLGFYGWRQRSTPGALPFAVVCLLWILWMLGTVGEIAAKGAAAKQDWFLFQALWQLPVTTAVTCFVLEFVYPGKYLTRRNLALLSIPPLAAAVFVLTNPHLHLMWTNLTVVGLIVRPALTPLAWLMVGYAMALAGVQLVALVWLYRRSPQHRWPAALMAGAILISRLAFVYDLLVPAGATAINSIPLVLLLPAITYTIALFGFHLFDPVPTARRAVIEQLSSGVVVFDTGWHVLSLNATARRVLGIGAAPARGKSWQQLLADVLPLPGGNPYAGAAGNQAGAAPTPHAGAPAEATDSSTVELMEIELGEPQSRRFYAPTLSQLKDFRGLLVGHLLLLLDVTEHKMAQQQAVEHERKTAVLQERERLARELHDGIAQTLAAAYLQTNTAKLLLARGDLQQAAACLDDLAELALGAQTDVRDYLFGAKTLFAGEERFFPTLRQYLVRFTRQYDLAVQLEVPAALEQQGLPAPVEVQLLRIIQEALSNVRKHARGQETTGSGFSSHRPAARVSFAAMGPCLRVSIADNGPGFDPARAAARGDGYGLRTMRERAQSVGGSLEILSCPGQGTEVLVMVPLDGFTANALPPA